MPTTKNLRFFFIILAITIVCELEARIFLSVIFKEPLLLIYPLKAKTDNVINISYGNSPKDMGTSYIKEINGMPAIFLKEGKSKGFNGARFIKDEINSDGYRGVLNKYRAGLKTIFCIGGSSTYGDGVNFDATYPAKLQGYLDHHGRNRYLVYNLGVRGSTSKGFLARIRSLSFKVKPDYLVIYAGHNDTEEHSYTFDANARYDTELKKLINKPILSSLCKYSLLFREPYVWFFLSRAEPKFLSVKDILSETLAMKFNYPFTQITIERITESCRKYRDNISETIDYIASLGGEDYLYGRILQV